MEEEDHHFDNHNLSEDDDLISEAPSMTPSMAEEASFIGSVSGIPTDEELGIDDYRASRKQHQERRKMSQERFHDEQNSLHDIDEETAQEHDDEYFEDYHPRGSSRNYGGSYRGGGDDDYYDDPSYRSGRDSSRRGSNSYRGSHRDSSRRGSEQQFSLFNTLNNIDDGDNSDESEPDILPGRRASMLNRGSDRSLQRPEQNVSYHNEMNNNNNNRNGSLNNNNQNNKDDHERPVWFWPLVTGACCCLLIIVIVIVVALLLLSGDTDDGDNGQAANVTRVRPTPRPSAAPTLAPTITAAPTRAPITPTTNAPVTPSPSNAPTARMPELICWSRNVAADWFVHANAAQSFQGTLVTISDVTIQNHVELAINNGSGGGQVWIGLNDNDIEGTYVWEATGQELNIKSEFAINAFAFEQPDNGGGTFVNLENCIQIDTTILPADSGFYAWRDSDCFSAATAIYQLPEMGKYRVVDQTLPVFQSTQCASEAWNLGNFGGCVNEAGEVLPPCSGTDVVNVNEDRIFCRNDGLADWFFHASIAQRYGGSLVQIEDEATNNLVKLLANSGNAPTWIGLNAHPSGTGWIWSWGINPTGTGTILNVGDAGAFFDFATNQPSGGTDETCVSLSPTDEYQWNDDVCGSAGHKAIYQLPRLATCHVLQAGGGFDCIDGSGNPLTELNSC